ncbi:UNVERIFIED_CONTAM: hypothetical protein GTU68_020256 [Idotea baltica]|nr:hypothetical protein [Idotea baltica]
MIISIKAFEELSLDELHDILQLRVAVFVLEQDCPYQDLDGKDKIAEHLIAMDGDNVLATLRILPPGVAYEEWAIGRVVVAEEARGNGLGHTVMERAIEHIAEQSEEIKDIKLSAQEHLKTYYAYHGFMQCGDGYLEDGIPHIPMTRSANQ